MKRIVYCSLVALLFSITINPRPSGGGRSGGDGGSFVPDPSNIPTPTPTPIPTPPTPIPNEVKTGILAFVSRNKNVFIAAGITTLAAAVAATLEAVLRGDKSLVREGGRKIIAIPKKLSNTISSKIKSWFKEQTEEDQQNLLENETKNTLKQKIDSEGPDYEKMLKINNNFKNFVNHSPTKNPSLEESSAKDISKKTFENNDISEESNAKAAIKQAFEKNKDITIEDIKKLPQVTNASSELQQSQFYKDLTTSPEKTKFLKSKMIDNNHFPKLKA